MVRTVTFVLVLLAIISVLEFNDKEQQHANERLTICLTAAGEHIDPAVLHECLGK